MKEDAEKLCKALSHELQAVGRMIGSKKGLDEQGFDDLIAALKSHTHVLRVAKHIEYGNKK